MVERHLSNRHILALDGLRGLAIIAVIFCHVNWELGGPFASGAVDGPVAMIFAWGWIGVDLFFVLSGFLITGILFDAKGCPGYFRNFYARRALRIIPLYYGFLFFVVALNRIDTPMIPWISKTDLLWLGTYTYNFRVGLGGAGIDDMHHFWSLAIEEQFYLIWPLAVLALSRRNLMWTCVVIAAASFLLRLAIVASGARPISAFFLTPCRVDGLIAGSWLALAWRNQSDWERVRAWAAPTAWGIAAVLLAIALAQGHFIPDADINRMPLAVIDGRVVVTVGLAALAIVFSAVIVLALNLAERSWLRQFLESRWLCAVGKYSYAIYVFHALILSLTVQVFSPASELPLFAAKWAVVIWVLATSFVVAWGSYHLYEKHFLRLKARFECDHSAEMDKFVEGAGLGPALIHSDRDS
jgi:peptidoglycan/LPS O-acetylase OafA/YrhL